MNWRLTLPIIRTGNKFRYEWPTIRFDNMVLPDQLPAKISEFFVMLGIVDPVNQKVFTWMDRATGTVRTRINYPDHPGGRYQESSLKITPRYVFTNQHLKVVLDNISKVPPGSRRYPVRVALRGMMGNVETGEGSGSVLPDSGFDHFRKLKDIVADSTHFDDIAAHYSDAVPEVITTDPMVAEALTALFTSLACIYFLCNHLFNTHYWGRGHDRFTERFVDEIRGVLKFLKQYAATFSNNGWNIINPTTTHRGSVFIDSRDLVTRDERLRLDVDHIFEDYLGFLQRG